MRNLCCLCPFASMTLGCLIAIRCGICRWVSTTLNNFFDFLQLGDTSYRADSPPSLRGALLSSGHFNFFWSGKIMECIKVSIFGNGVEFWAKRFRLPAGDSRQGGLCSAWKATGLPSRRVWAESPGAWLPACTKGSPRLYLLGGGEGHRAGLFAQWKCLFSLQDSLRQTHPTSLAAKSQPVRHKQGGWVGCVLTDCLWLIQGKILCIFWEKCQGGCVDTIFKNPDIFSYIIMYITSSYPGFAVFPVWATLPSW